jgi:2-hydroxy-6-oxonona-2,4-dienedioate hydrolase
MLLPGLMGGDWIWRSTVEELSRAGYGTIVWNAAVATLDHGRATSPITEICTGALAIVDDLGIEEVLVCGNSLGALLALEFASKHPQHTAGLVLSGCPGLEENMLDMGYVLSHSQREVVEEYRSRMFYSEPEGLDEFIKEGIEMVLDRPTAIKTLAAFRAARTHDTVGSLGGVACPTRLIWGQHDLITPLDNWMPHISELRDAELHVVPACGHSPMIEKTDEWLALVLDFVSRVIPLGQTRQDASASHAP